MIDDVKRAKCQDWYSKLKRITRFDQGRSEKIQVEAINHLSDKNPAEMVADHQAKISNSYKGIKRMNIDIPSFGPEDIPQLPEAKVKVYICMLKSRKSTPPGNMPVKIKKKGVCTVPLYSIDRYHQLKFQTRIQRISCV